MTTRYLKVEKRKNGVTIVTLDNPPLNIITLQMTQEIIQTFESLEKDESVRSVVITGSGGKAFCAGADVKEFSEVRDQVVEKKLAEENTAFAKIQFLSKPVIAAITGYALGGGCELALACDIRILAEDIEVGFPEINLGVFPGSGGLYRLPKLVGMSKAMELMYTGGLISAHEAHRIGLANRVVSRKSVMDEAIHLAEKVAKQPREALKAIKTGVRETLTSSYEDALKINLELSDKVFKTEDCSEGINAFFEKREPRFR